MKKILAVIICMIAAMSLVCCDDSEARIGEAIAYGSTNACPVRVNIKADGDGKVCEVKIEEFLSVYNIGRLDGQKKYGVSISDCEDGYAKFVRAGGRVFEYQNGSYVDVDATGEDKSFDALVNTEEGAEWYIHCVKEGDFDIVDASGKSEGVPFTEYDKHKLDKKEWADKLKNGYHEGVEYDDGFKENIYNLVTHIKNHGFYEYVGSEKPSGKKSTYKVGKYDTLVNLEGFHDYMRIARLAYERACEAANKK